MQHGEQITNPNGFTRAKELGHFIAKIQDEYMQGFLQKFNEQYKGKKYVEIEFCNNNPLTKKYSRNNQSGEVCRCYDGETTGSQKTKEGWKTIECNETCQYRQKNEQGKSACNRIAWLKFFIPSISKDRIWLMRISGQRSINRIDSYIKLQTSQGNDLNGRYILFLKQEEQQSRATGQTFNNYVLDIIKKEDFIQANQIPQSQKDEQKQSTDNTENVDNDTKKDEGINTNIISNTNQTDNTAEVPKESNKEKANTKPKNPKKQTKVRTKKTEETKKESIEENQEEQEEKQKTSGCCDNYYIFDSLTEEIITTANGQKKNYSVGKFYDINDKTHNIIIKPQYAKELQICELGTIVELTQIQEVNGRKFALDCKFIQKMQKNIAA